MSEKSKQSANRMIIFESFFSIVIILTYIWLANVLVGIFLLLFVVMVITWGAGLVISIILYKSSKRQIAQEYFDKVESGDTYREIKPPFRLKDDEEKL